MATVVCHKTAEINSIGTAQYRLYDVVDGQQRLTTLILMLKCIELDLPDGSEDRQELARILVKRDGHLILLHFAYYDFCRVHKSLRVTPAMEAGLTDHVWELRELLAVA